MTVGLLVLDPLATLAYFTVDSASWAAWVGWAVFAALFVTGAVHTVLTLARSRVRARRPGEQADDRAVGRGFWAAGTVWFRGTRSGRGRRHADEPRGAAADATSAPQTRGQRKSSRPGDGIEDLSR